MDVQMVYKRRSSDERSVSGIVSSASSSQKSQREKTSRSDENKGSASASSASRNVKLTIEENQGHKVKTENLQMKRSLIIEQNVIGDHQRSSDHKNEIEKIAFLMWLGTRQK